MLTSFNQWSWNHLWYPRPLHNVAHSSELLVNIYSRRRTFRLELLLPSGSSNSFALSSIGCIFFVDGGVRRSKEFCRDMLYWRSSIWWQFGWRVNNLELAATESMWLPLGSSSVAQKLEFARELFRTNLLFELIPQCAFANLRKFCNCA